MSLVISDQWGTPYPQMSCVICLQPIRHTISTSEPRHLWPMRLAMHVSTNALHHIRPINQVISDRLGMSYPPMSQVISDQRGMSYPPMSHARHIYRTNEIFHKFTSNKMLKTFQLMTFCVIECQWMTGCIAKMSVDDMLGWSYASWWHDVLK